uniref:Uncharacterized protein n=1 Tax=Arundo donax TaxID=35708 RepID=A0A0A9F8K5_ARUDO
MKPTKSNKKKEKEKNKGKALDTSPKSIIYFAKRLEMKWLRRRRLDPVEAGWACSPKD